MGNGTRAIMVLIATVFFFAVSIFGPPISEAGGDLVQFLSSAATGTDAERYGVDRTVANNPKMMHARECCADCGMTWGYSLDRCEITHEEATICVAECGSGRIKFVPVDP